MELFPSVERTIEQNKIGYISVQTPSGKISTNPVSYYFEDGYIYFMTPRGSKRFKFMQKRSDVTFMVDNGKLMEECAGIMIQGEVEIFNQTKTFFSTNVMPKLLKYLKKYPEGIPFYALGTLGLKNIPSERKLYKYNFLRINPTKVFYWDGYNFGRISVKSGEIIEDDPVLLARQALKGDFSITEEEAPGFDILDVLNLSPTLRKTALTLAMFGEATPEKIAIETTLPASTERANLNSLVRMGYALKPEEKNEYIMED